MEILEVLTLWLHVSSVVVLIGGIIYARVEVAQVLRAMQPEEAARAADQMAARFRPLALGAMAALLLSGTYKLLTNPGHSRYYLMLLGVKLLLVLHVFAATFVLTAPAASPERQAKRPRLMAGVAISGLAIIMLSAYLRRIF
ncbi:MAG: hypothetical protein HYR60_20130 [Acidobacteria bacterium]|nr:hypothetical protein [Acidobacteriota bacterium]MBI3470205.1 hypothetical protein [Candidatus Solibacter usitatus]